MVKFLRMKQMAELLNGTPSEVDLKIFLETLVLEDWSLT